MGTFDDDFNTVDDIFAEVFGGTVEIHRGASSTTRVTAEPIVRDYEVIDSDGIVTTVHVRDYVIDVANYQIATLVTDPRDGDRIKETIGDDVHVFEVVPIADRQCREWVGMSKPQWVIHTKFVGTE